MATVVESAVSQEIGAMAGIVWRYLDVSGPVTLTKLAKEIDAPRDLVMQAVGWLAREDKVTIENTARKKTIRLLK